MAKQVQLRRGTTAELSSVTGAIGEVIVDTTKDTLTVHDGYTVGGTPLLKEDLGNLGNNTIGLGKIATGTHGQVLYYSSTGQLTTLAPGTSGQYLKTQGSGANPVWATVVQKCLGTGATKYNNIVRSQSRYTTFADTGWNISYTSTAANSKFRISFQTNWGQGDTWRGGCVRFVRNVNGGGYNYLSSEDSWSGTRHTSYTSGINGNHTFVHMMGWDDPGQAAGTVFNFKVQISTDSRGDPVTLGVHSTSQENSDSTGTAGLTTLVIEEFA